MKSETNGMLLKNEEQANRVVAKVMRVTFLILTVIMIMNLVGIFIVNQTFMTAAYVAGGIVLWLPTILTKTVNTQAPYLKYVMVLCASVFLLAISTTLTYHAVVVYVYPIAIASLYFSKKLNVFATCITAVSVSVGQFLGFALQTTIDHNFMDYQEIIMFSVLPRTLCLICIAAIFTMLCSRTAEMLGNLLGAEEQEKMLGDMLRFRENNQKLSVKMKQTVEVLADHTQISNELNQKIATETSEIVRGTKDNSAQIEKMSDNLGTITQQMAEFEQMSDELAGAAEEIRVLSKDNQTTMNQTTASMKKIADSSKQCMESIGRLEVESKANDIQKISEMLLEEEGHDTDSDCRG